MVQWSQILLVLYLFAIGWLILLWWAYRVARRSRINSSSVDNTWYRMRDMMKDIDELKREVDELKSKRRRPKSPSLAGKT